MRYPVVLPRRLDLVHANRPHHKSLIAGKTWLGEIDVSPTDDSDWIAIHWIRQELAVAGFEYDPHRPHYGTCELTNGMGSISIHRDPDYGLVAATLIATMPIKKDLQDSWDNECCQIIASGRFAEIKIGDTFVFNSDRDHAWIANCRWVLLTQTIKKQRRIER